MHSWHPHHTEPYYNFAYPHVCHLRHYWLTLLWIWGSGGRLVWLFQTAVCNIYFTANSGYKTELPKTWWWLCWKCDRNLIENKIYLQTLKESDKNQRACRVWKFVFRNEGNLSFFPTHTLYYGCLLPSYLY